MYTSMSLLMLLSWQVFAYSQGVGEVEDIKIERTPMLLNAGIDEQKSISGLPSNGTCLNCLPPAAPDLAGERGGKLKSFGSVLQSNQELSKKQTIVILELKNKIDELEARISELEKEKQNGSR